MTRYSYSKKKNHFCPFLSLFINFIIKFMMVYPINITVKHQLNVSLMLS